MPKSLLTSQPLYKIPFGTSILTATLISVPLLYPRPVRCARSIKGLAKPCQPCRISCKSRILRLSVRGNAGSSSSSSSSSGLDFSVIKGKVKGLLHTRHDKDILNLAIPALFGILLDPIMSLTDTALVGRLGPAQLAAVGLSGITFAFSSVVFNFLLFITTPNVAAAVAQEDREKASSVTANGLWVALISGICLAAFIWFSAPFVVGTVLGADPEVTMYAVTYLQCRSVACPALLGVYVATGSFRGHKDTRTPLVASVVSNIINLGLDLVLMFGLGWGVAGAAIATSISQYVSFFFLYWRMRATKMLLASHARALPSKKQVQPFLKSGLALSTRSVVVMGTYVFATSLVATLGSATLAASEILRQIFILSMQSFMALDISSQALVASYLGRGNRAMARDVLIRTMQLGGAVGLVTGGVIYCSSTKLPLLFSSDAKVQAVAANSLPVLAAFMPLDAVASVMDGGLLGASETSWVARAAIFNSLLVISSLLVMKRVFPGSLSALWLSMKLMSVGRLISGTYRYSSPDCKLSVARRTP